MFKTKYLTNNLKRIKVIHQHSTPTNAYVKLIERKSNNTYTLSKRYAFPCLQWKA